MSTTDINFHAVSNTKPAMLCVNFPKLEHNVFEILFRLDINGFFCMTSFFVACIKFFLGFVAL